MSLADKIAQARQLDAEATPGPWFAGDCDMAGSVTTGDGDRVCSDDNILVAVQADFDLIAHARNHHAALWAVAEAAERWSRPDAALSEDFKNTGNTDETLEPLLSLAHANSEARDALRAALRALAEVQ